MRSSITVALNGGVISEIPRLPLTELLQGKCIAAINQMITIGVLWRTRFPTIAQRSAIDTLKATRLPQQFDSDISLTKAYDTTAMLIRYPVALFGSLPISQNVSSTPLP